MADKVELEKVTRVAKKHSVHTVILSEDLRGETKKGCWNGGLKTVILMNLFRKPDALGGFEPHKVRRDRRKAAGSSIFAVEESSWILTPPHGSDEPFGPRCCGIPPTAMMTYYL
jgi:hypothetical protein